MGAGNQLKAILEFAKGKNWSPKQVRKENPSTPSENKKVYERHLLFSVTFLDSWSMSGVKCPILNPRASRLPVLQGRHWELQNGNNHLSRLQSFTEPSAAQEAKLTSFWSNETVDLGWNTIAPTFVLWPKEMKESRVRGFHTKECEQTVLKW